MSSLWRAPRIFDVDEAERVLLVTEHLGQGPIDVPVITALQAVNVASRPGEVPTRPHDTTYQEAEACTIANCFSGRAAVIGDELRSWGHLQYTCSTNVCKYHKVANV